VCVEPPIIVDHFLPCMGPIPEVPLRPGDVPSPRPGVSVTLEPEKHQKVVDTISILVNYIYVQHTKCRDVAREANAGE